MGTGFGALKGVPNALILGAGKSGYPMLYTVYY